MFDEKELGNLILSDDFITTDKYLLHARECDFCHYLKSDLFLRSRTWRSEATGSFLRYRKLPSETNLIVGHSDDSFGRAKQAVAHLKGFKSIFGVNLKKSGLLSTPIPLGLTNPTNESALHEVFGNTDLIRKVWQDAPSQTAYSRSIYANFTIETNIAERLPLKKLLIQKNVGFHEAEVSLTGRAEYLRRIRQANFTVCPEGNGVDTHRIWEALYMQSIPIVKSNPILNPLLENLPVVIVNKWSQIFQEDFLMSHWNNLQDTVFPVSKISATYWNQIFLNTHN